MLQFRNRTISQVFETLSLVKDKEFSVIKPMPVVDVCLDRLGPEMKELSVVRSPVVEVERVITTIFESFALQVDATSIASLGNSAMQDTRERERDHNSNITLHFHMIMRQ